MLCLCLYEPCTTQSSPMPGLTSLLHHGAEMKGLSFSKTSTTQHNTQPPINMIAWTWPGPILTVTCNTLCLYFTGSGPGQSRDWGQTNKQSQSWQTLIFFVAEFNFGVKYDDRLQQSKPLISSCIKSCLTIIKVPTESDGPGPSVSIKC